MDLLQPWNGGWGRLIESISSARKEAVPLGDKYLGLESFFDPKLLAAAPVSFVKYPLSYMVKSPVFAAVVGYVLLLFVSTIAESCVITMLTLAFSCFFSALLFFSFVGDADALTANDSVSTTDLAESLLFSILETVVFARIFLKELLADRNTVLAENIVSKMLFFFFVAVWYIASHSSWSYGIRIV